MFYTGFWYVPCDADPRYGSLLASPVATFHNHTVLRLNVSFPFNNVSKNYAALHIYNSTVLGHIDRLLATAQPPLKRAYDVTRSGTTDGYYDFEVCLPSGTYALMFLGSMSETSEDQRNANSASGSSPIIIIHSVNIFISDKECPVNKTRVPCGGMSLNELLHILQVFKGHCHYYMYRRSKRGTTRKKIIPTLFSIIYVIMLENLEFSTC